MHVLKAIDLGDDEPFQTIRPGLGRATQHTEKIADVLIERINHLRK